MDTGKTALSLLAGVAAGALLGILFAPDKGSETRKKILAKGDDLTDSMKEKIKDFVEKIKEESELGFKANGFRKNGATKNGKLNS